MAAPHAESGFGLDFAVSDGEYAMPAFGGAGAEKPMALFELPDELEIAVIALCLHDASGR